MNSDLLQHMIRLFGPVQESALPDTSTGVKIHVIPPSTSDGSIVLFTAGMSNQAQNVPEGREEYRYTELLLRLPATWPLDTAALQQSEHAWPFHWLGRIADHPRTHHTWLGGPYSIVGPDEPATSLAPNTRLSCLLLLRKRGEEDTVVCEDGRTILLYSVIPLYPEERELERSNGLRELLTRFNARNISTVVDLQRPNVARGTPVA